MHDSNSRHHHSTQIKASIRLPPPSKGPWQTRQRWWPFLTFCPGLYLLILLPRHSLCLSLSSIHCSSLCGRVPCRGWMTGSAMVTILHTNCISMFACGTITTRSVTRKPLFSHAALQRTVKKSRALVILWKFSLILQENSQQVPEFLFKNYKLEATFVRVASLIINKW